MNTACELMNNTVCEFNEVDSSGLLHFNDQIITIDHC